MFTMSESRLCHMVWIIRILEFRTRKYIGRFLGMLLYIMCFLTG
jgi:hypothetical protein